jgi:hypothetical protein
MLNRQPKVLFVPSFFPPPSTNAGLVLCVGAGIALAALIVGELIQGSSRSEPRDTYKYVYIRQDRVKHGGITNDLARREREHRRRWPGGRIHQVGSRVTRRSARAWEGKFGF